MTEPVILGYARKKIEAGEVMFAVWMEGNKTAVISDKIAFKPWGKKKVLKRILSGKF